MAGFDFIKIYETLNEALTIKSSPYESIFTYSEVQLLPNNPLPYIQRTSNPNGVEIEDWTAYIVDMCSGVKEDVTAYFEVSTVFFDDNGANQIQWQLLNLPTDYGCDLVYLEIDQLGQSYFSSPFLLSATNSEWTKRFDYGNELNVDMQSIQLRIAYRQRLRDTEISSYNEISTNTTVTTTTLSSDYKKFITGEFSVDRLIQLSDIFCLVYTFCELQRVNLYKPIEIPEIVGYVNSVQAANVYLSFESLMYDPFYVAPQPPPPPLPLSDYSPDDYNANDYKTTV